VNNCGEYWRIILEFTGVYAIILASESLTWSDSDPRLQPEACVRQGFQTASRLTSSKISSKPTILALCGNYFGRDRPLLFRPLTSAPGILINHEDQCEASLSFVSAQKRHSAFEDQVSRTVGAGGFVTKQQGGGSAYARHAQMKLPALEDYEHPPK
jgi:hypothetical protein